MNDEVFFKYFNYVEICYVLYDSTLVIYTLEGVHKDCDGIVFNIVTENAGLLSVNIIRKNWRIDRTIKNLILPTHISVVKYDPNATNRLKTFSDYNGISESYRICNITVNIEKWNYLIYIYRDVKNAEFTPDDKLNIKIICT